MMLWGSLPRCLAPTWSGCTAPTLSGCTAPTMVGREAPTTPTLPGCVAATLSGCSAPTLPGCGAPTPPPFSGCEEGCAAPGNPRLPPNRTSGRAMTPWGCRVPPGRVAPTLSGCAAPKVPGCQAPKAAKLSRFVAPTLPSCEAPSCEAPTIASFAGCEQGCAAPGNSRTAGAAQPLLRYRPPPAARIWPMSGAPPRAQAHSASRCPPEGMPMNLPCFGPRLSAPCRGG